MSGTAHKVIDRTALIAPPGREILLNDVDPADTVPFETKGDAQTTLAANTKRLAALQDIFYADRRRALLVILQGMDAAGKDGVIRHVMSGVSPQGVDVHAFSTPTPEELAHDFFVALRDRVAGTRPDRYLQPLLL